MQIYRIPVLRDNYIFLLHDQEQNIAAVVDPAQAENFMVKLYYNERIGYIYQKQNLHSDYHD
jgi:hypothetical protein